MWRPCLTAGAIYGISNETKRTPRHAGLACGQAPPADAVLIIAEPSDLYAGPPGELG